MNILIRQTTNKDITQILEVENGAWRNGGSATKKMFEARIQTFAEGVLVAELNHKIIGVVATERVNYDVDKNAFKWSEITDNGYITKTHTPDGDTIYGVDLSVLPEYQQLGVGSKLLETIGKLAIRYNLKQGVLGGRIPGYYKYANRMTAEEYIKMKDGNKYVDPEINFYKKVPGLRIVKLIPDYYPDSESLNYGVLLQWQNPFYNKWYRWIGTKLFKI